MKKEIPVFKPMIQQEEIDAAVGALEMGWLGMGSYVGRFEQALKDYLGAHDRQVVALSTGHAALHLGLLIAGVGPGDEVITPSFNNVADFQAILATGAQPVFCDIDIDSLCIDLNKVEELITPRTKVLIVMDYDCVLADHDRVAEIAKKHHLRVLHDAAHSFGSSDKGRKVGTFSDLCMFSFDPVKTITCLDGGALIVKSPEEEATLREMRLVGMGQPSSVMYQNRRAWTYDVKMLGFRYHMANLHAAIGLAQLAKMDQISASRQRLCRHYNERLNSVRQVVTPKTDFEEITPFLYYIRIIEGDRSEFQSFMTEQGVDTGIHWQPGHWFSLLKNCRRGDLSVTETIGRQIVSLPLHSDMSIESVDLICDAIFDFFSSAKR